MLGSFWRAQGRSQDNGREGEKWEAPGKEVGTVTKYLNGLSESISESPQLWESCFQVPEQ